MLNKLLIALFIFCIPKLILGQEYLVDSFTKINELNGNFNITLDNNDWFGYSVESIGDLNQDGVEDVVVSSALDDDGGNNIGALYVMFLNSDGTVNSNQKISAIQGGFYGNLDSDDYFGSSISFLGDINNDGYLDIAVGSEYDGDGGYRHGAVWILSLNNNGTVFSYSKISDTEGNFLGILDDFDVFGSDIEVLGDLNNDGVVDIAVGARRDDDGGLDKGAVWILFMNSDLTVSSFQKISEVSGNLNTSLSNSDYFGGSVANIGDLNGDGVIDLAVGAYRDDYGGNNKGAIYILFMNTDGTVSSTQKIGQNTGGFNENLSVNCRFGKSIDFANDINQDGKKDIVVGCGAYGEGLQNIGYFYILNLNSNGTVDSFYKYGEGLSGFLGDLNPNEYFGFSVSYMGNFNNCNLSILVGAFGDSENGTDKGAVWILNLGEVNYNISSIINPTLCGSSDGSFTISGLEPDIIPYTITYTHESGNQVITSNADSVGEIFITLLSSGVYSDIFVENDITGCAVELEDVVLTSPNLSATVSFISPTICGGMDGSITISDLAPNTNYIVEYEINSVNEILNLTSDSGGIIVLNGVLAGAYDNFTITEELTNCTENFEQIFIPEPDFVLDFTWLSPTSCGVSDGSILISNLLLGESYVVDYYFESLLVQNIYTANSDGEILLSNLDSGNYEEIMVIGNLSPCSDGIGLITLETPEFDLSISSTNPSSCGEMDGSITISELSINMNYTISFEYNSVLETYNLISNLDGQIQINGLSSGIYNNVIVTENDTSCSDDLGTFVLNEPDFDLIFSSIDLTSCGSLDGVISISGLSPNEAYTINYNYDAISETLNVISNSSGVIEIIGLQSGNYSSIVVIEDESGCTDNFDLLILDEPDNISFPSTVQNPTSCETLDGIITISELTPNTNFIVSYVLDNENVVLSLSSNEDGIIEITALGSGIYNFITVENEVTDCSGNFPQIELSCTSTSDHCFNVKKFFTPNNDGDNDNWGIEILSNDCSLKTYIYDRYGKLIKTLIQGKSWDGTINGYKMQTSDYWYSIHYTINNEDFIYKSHFTLKRHFQN